MKISLRGWLGRHLMATRVPALKEMYLREKAAKIRGLPRRRGRGGYRRLQRPLSALFATMTSFQTPRSVLRRRKKVSLPVLKAFVPRTRKMTARTATRIHAAATESLRPSFLATRPRNVSHLWADWRLFYLRSPSASLTSASSPRPLPGQIFYSMFYFFPSQTIFYFTLLLFYNFHPTPSFVRPGKCYAPFTTLPRTLSRLKLPSP